MRNLAALLLLPDIPIPKEPVLLHELRKANEGRIVRSHLAGLGPAQFPRGISSGALLSGGCPIGRAMVRGSKLLAWLLRALVLLVGGVGPQKPTEEYSVRAELVRTLDPFGGHGDFDLGCARR